MKRLLVLSVLLFTVFFSYTVVAQEFGSLRKGYQITFPEKIHKLVLDPLPAGTYSIGTGGDFPTIDSAFNKLSIDGVAGEITLELIDELYTAPTNELGFSLNGPIPGAGSSSRVIIKPAANKNVTIEGSGENILNFINTSYLTLDGVELTGSATLTIHSLYNIQYSWNTCADFWNNSDHNVVQNITFISDDYTRNGGGPGFWTRAGQTGTCDSNLIQNNFIKKAGWGIYVSSYNSSLRAEGNIIKGNLIGSDTDSLIAWGIQVEHCHNTIIENNIVQNLKVTTTVGEILIPGINSYWGSGDIIKNNIVRDIQASGGYSGVGILLSGQGNWYGSNNMVYNNMVYDIQSTSTQAYSRVAGIQMWDQNNPKIHYNTVYLSGNVNGTNPYGSAALYIWGNCTNVEAKNNILVNTRNEVPYIACCINVENAAILTSDYNDLYYEPSTYNCLVRVGMTKYNTLANWQATGKDLHSYVEMPNFIAPDNLHINSLIPTYIESGGTPIAGIELDFDGDLRNTSKPDIGADEINGIVLPVELTSFTAEALDQKIILKWTTATELNNNGFEIQRRVTESDFVTVGFVRGEGTTTNQREYSYIDKNLTDGKYFYRLKQVDYNGTYEYSNVVEVDVRSLNEYALEQNYPNPFNPTTTIGYVLKEKSNTKLTLLNAIGEEVAVLLNEEQDKGFHKVDFNASAFASGVYFYRLQAGEFVQSRKMILLK